MQVNKRKDDYQNAATVLKDRRDDLIASFQKGSAKGFLNQHTRILDEYFREQFENSAVGPRIGISRNPYVFIALGGGGLISGVATHL